MAERIVRRRSAKQDGEHHIEVSDGDTGINVIGNQDSFQWRIWLVLALQNWLFDFGRPIAALFVPLEWSPLNRPSIGDFFHMAHNIITPFCILKLHERCPRRVPSTVTHLSVITYVMGASIHLVGDSVNHRLIHFGYKNHLSVRENPIMQKLEPKELVNSFELLYSYDEEIGHLMWYVPFFFSLFLYFIGCFVSSDSQPKGRITLWWWILAVVSAVYFWYLVTEGQIFSVYISTVIAMIGMTIWEHRRRNKLDINGKFLYTTFLLTSILIVVWSVLLWNDSVLRRKYPGWFYLPEPWAYYTLCYHKSEL